MKSAINRGMFTDVDTCILKHAKSKLTSNDSPSNTKWAIPYLFYQYAHGKIYLNENAYFKFSFSDDDLLKEDHGSGGVSAFNKTKVSEFFGC